MKVIIKQCDSMPCSAETFIINGMNASLYDFGEMQDTAENDAEPYSCMCEEFVPDELPQDGVLEKYSISIREYEIIQEAISAEMYVGHCSLCV